MATTDIARLRLQHQHIGGTGLHRPQDIVSWLGAMQAQDYTMAKWGIGIRLPGHTEAAIEAAVTEGDIIRTHILRPTWHFVSAQDIRWMTALSAPRLETSLRSLNNKLELTPALLKKSYGLIEKALSGNKHLTRPELMALLANQKIRTDEFRSSHIMFGAEISGLVCNGPVRGKQHTYALLDERVAAAPAISRPEAVARLTLRYFSSHGPATVADFAWWSNLPLKEIRQGLEDNREHLACIRIKEQEYWLPAAGPAHGAARQEVHLLPAFDEFMVSYKDRSASLDPALGGAVITANGIFKPMIAGKGKIKGSWKRTVQKGKTQVSSDFFRAEDALTAKALQPALKAYATFLGETLSM